MPGWASLPLAGDFSVFIARTLATINPGAAYIPGWHIQLIAEYLEAARRGDITRLIINLPPRSLKSTCVSVAWPAWILGHDPSSRIVAASYAASLSIKHSIDCRAVVSSPWYRQIFPQTMLARDQNEKHKFMTMDRGFRLAASVGGAITGEGGNFLIIDDPLNPLQAMNRKRRDAINAWFSHTFSSRLDDKRRGAIVLVMQRLHAQDLSGHLLSQGGWHHLSLPAIAESPMVHSFGCVHKLRAAGDILHPGREDQALVELARKELGSHAFAAQYQQRPLNEKSSMVKIDWLDRYDDKPSLLERYVQSWDTAIKSHESNDASVCITFGEWQGKSYVMDVVKVRHEYPELKKLFYALAGKWRPEAILIEDKASGQQLLQDARRDSHLPVIACMPAGNKLVRFAAVSALIEARRLVLPRRAEWLAAFEEEILNFPHLGHDDQVDALTQYLQWIRNKSNNSIGIRSI